VPTRKGDFLIILLIVVILYELFNTTNEGQKATDATTTQSQIARMPTAASPANCFRLKDQEGQDGTLYTTHFVPYCGETAAEITHVRAALPTRCSRGELMVYSMDIETGQGEDALCEVASEPLVAELYRSIDRYTISGVILLDKP
jgi:hypothetical protein